MADTTPPPGRDAPRRSAWRVRKRVWGGIAAGIGALALVAWFVMLRMPGRCWDGPLPPLGADGAAVRAEVERDVRTLGGEIGERSVFRSAALEAAARHVEQRFEDAGLAPRRETYALGGGRISNVIAEVAGGARRAEIVVVGAHYDSVAGSPGANDDATGVAALLALARRFAAAGPARTLRFVAFTGEEPPCFKTETMGSLVHARGCVARREDVVAMLALETLGSYSDAEGSQEYPVRGMALAYPTRGDFVSFVGDVGSRDLVRTAIGAFRAHAAFPSVGAALPAYVPGVDWSDHWSFRQVGVPAVMVTDTAIFRDRMYHTGKDVPARVDYERLARVTLGLVAVVEALVDPQE